MKSCVVTANYACDPNKVWLYLTKPTPEQLAQRTSAGTRKATTA